MTPDIKSFPFQELEVLSRSDIARTNAAIDAIEARLRSGALREDLNRIIEKTFERRQVQLDTVRCAYFREASTLDTSAWLGLLSGHSGAGPALLMVDPGLIQSWLQEIFDESTSRPGAELDPEDWGAVAFGVLQVLKILTDRGMQPLMLASTPPHQEALDRYFKRHALHEFSWIVTDHAAAGWVRLLMPEAMVDSMVSASTSLAAAALANAVERPILGETRLRFGANLGRRSVPRREFSSLRRGDILMPESHCLKLDSIELRQPYRPGSLSRGPLHISGHLDASEAQWRFILEESAEELHVLHHEDPMSEPTDTSSTGPSEGAAGADEKTQTLNISALNAAHVEVDVRVGSLEMSVAELARIQPGKVLELDRKVGELVDLVVDGHVHATGELVNIEGVIGVRVTSLKSR